MTLQQTRFAAVPLALRTLQQWARWRKGTRDKMPANLDNTTMKWGDRANWLAFDKVARFDKIGWFLTPETGVLVADLDGCRNPATGKVHPLALDFVRRSHSYAEISPSATGLKIYLKGTLPGNKPIISKAVPWGDPAGHTGIEIYAEKRFIAVTGGVLPGCPSEISEAPEVLNEMLVRFAPAPKAWKKAEPTESGAWDFDAWVRTHLDVQESLADGYSITCPWAGEHSTPGDTARIWSGPPHTFHCFHAHCANRTWHDLRQKYEPNAYAEYLPSSGASNGNGNGHHDTTFDLCSFDADDAGNSDAMNALYGRDFLYCASLGWLRYTNTHWSLDADGAEVRKCAIETLRRRRHAAVDAEKEAIIKCTKADERRVNGCVSLFKTHVSTDIKTFDCDPDVLNCQNGVVNLRTGLIEPHSRAQRFTYCVPVEYDLQADSSQWVDYLRGVIGGGQEVLDYVQEALGYSFTGHTQEEILFYLFGPTRSGKGTYAETIMTLLPTPLSKMVDFQSFTAKREGDVSNFDLAPLKPARIIFASESNKSQNLNPAKIKQLTGGDHISCCFKHKDFFSYRPQFKVWMMSNHPVNGDPEDDALWGRVRVIEFPHSFLGMEDKTKKARLKEPDALKGVLAWIVQGAARWYALGSQGLITPEAIEAITKAQRDDLDLVQQWLDECCEDNEGGWSSNEEVMTSYTAWCKSNNVQYPKGSKGLAQSLKGKGYEPGLAKKVGGKTKRGVGGLYIYPENDEPI